MKTHSCFFDLIKEAKENNGYVSIYNYREDEKVKNAKDAKELFESLFYHGWGTSWAIMDINKNEKVSEKQRQRFKEMDVSYKDNGLSFNLYAFFKIPEDKRTIEALDTFSEFFNECKSIILDGTFEKKIQCVNNHKPKVHLGIQVKDEPELSEKLNAFVHNQYMENWFQFLAKELGLIGHWSWFFISEKGLLNDGQQPRLERRGL